MAATKRRAHEIRFEEEDEGPAPKRLAQGERKKSDLETLVGSFKGAAREPLKTKAARFHEAGMKPMLRLGIISDFSRNQTVFIDCANLPDHIWLAIELLRSRNNCSTITLVLTKDDLRDAFTSMLGRAYEQEEVAQDMRLECTDKTMAEDIWNSILLHLDDEIVEAHDHPGTLRPGQSAFDEHPNLCHIDEINLLA